MHRFSSIREKDPLLNGKMLFININFTFGHGHGHNIPCRVRVSVRT